jgi:hypothetical protein
MHVRLMIWPRPFFVRTFTINNGQQYDTLDGTF